MNNIELLELRISTYADLSITTSVKMSLKREHNKL